MFVVIQWKPMDHFGQVSSIVLDQGKHHCDSLLQLESQFGRPKLEKLRMIVEKNGGQPFDLNTFHKLGIFHDSYYIYNF